MSLTAWTLPASANAAEQLALPDFRQEAPLTRDSPPHGHYARFLARVAADSFDDVVVIGRLRASAMPARLTLVSGCERGA
jgi:hypothetical protein